MPTTQEIVAAIRMYCGQPDYSRLDNGTICTHLYDQIDHLLNRFNLTDENWIIGRKEIPVSSDNDEYQMPDKFGRAIMIETVDDGTSYFIRREVQIVNVQDFNLYWSGYTTSGSYGGYSHSAEVAAFFGQDGSPLRTIKFAPPPYASCSYRVWYEINKQANPGLSTKPVVMEQFHNLLKVNTAIACLPNCGYNAEEFQAHMESLQIFKSEFDDVYERYIGQNHHEDTGERRAFNSSRKSGMTWW